MARKQHSFGDSVYVITRNQQIVLARFIAYVTGGRADVQLPSGAIITARVQKK